MTVSRSDNRTICFSPSTADTARALALYTGTAARYTATAGNTTTVTDTTLVGAGDDVYNGQLLEFLSGNNKGLRVDILDFVSATGVLTFQTMPATCAAGDTFRILQNTFPVFENETGADTTSIINTGINDADDYWIGCYARCLKATNIATTEMQKITDFANATGDATTDAFSAATANGDMFIFERPLLAEDLAYEHPVDLHERNPVRDTNAPEMSTVGCRRGGTVSFSMPLIGDNTGANASTKWTRSSSVLPLLESCFGVLTLGQGDADAAGGDDTDITVSDGTRFTAGTPVMINGEVRTIASIATNTLTLESALSADAASGDVVYNSASARYSATGHYPVNFEIWEDQVRYRYYGCYGTVTFNTDAAGRLMCAFSWQASAWDSFDETMPVTDIHEKYPDADVEDIIARDTPVRFDTTEVEASTYALDPALQISPRPKTGGIEGSAGFLVTGCKPTLTTDTVKESDAYDMDVVNRETSDHGAQFNAKVGNTAFFWMPKVQITASTTEESEGYFRNTIAAKAVVPDASDPLGETLIISIL